MDPVTSPHVDPGSCLALTPAKHSPRHTTSPRGSWIKLHHAPPPRWILDPGLASAHCSPSTGGGGSPRCHPHFTCTCLQTRHSPTHTSRLHMRTLRRRTSCTRPSHVCLLAAPNTQEPPAAQPAAAAAAAVMAVVVVAGRQVSACREVCRARACATSRYWLRSSGGAGQRPEQRSAREMEGGGGTWSTWCVGGGGGGGDTWSMCGG